METMEKLFKFKCGDKVKDESSGATGMISVRLQHVSGNIRYWVQPELLENGSPVPDFSMDEEGLTLVEATTKPSPARTFRFELGAKAKDKWSDLEGWIVVRQDHQHGCRRYEIQPTSITKEGKLAQGYSIDENAVVITKAAKADAVPKTSDGAEGIPSLPEPSCETR